MEKVRRIHLVCSNGHDFWLDQPQYPSEIISAICPCPKIIGESNELCSGVVVWRKSTIDKSG